MNKLFCVAIVAAIQILSTSAFANRCADIFVHSRFTDASQLVQIETQKSNAIGDLSVVELVSGRKLIVDFRSSQFSSQLEQVKEFGGTNVSEILDATSRVMGARLRSATPNWLSLERIGVVAPANYLELQQLRDHPELQGLYAALLAQEALKVQLNKASRVVTAYSLEDGRAKYLIAIQEGKTFKYFDPMTAGSVPVETVVREYLVSSDSLRIVRSGPTEKEGRKILPIDLGDGRGLVDFQVLGRSPSEKKFKREDEMIAAASDTDLVPIEFMHHAQFAPTGHTTIRVGNSLISFGISGWSVHEGGMESAVGYLMNNPALRRLADERKWLGAQPFTLGVSFLRPKSEIMAFLEHAREQARTGGGKPFHDIKNNCNQCPIETWIGFGWDQFRSADDITLFSSILTFNELLHSDSLESPEYHVYPFNSKVEEDGSIRERISVRLTGINSRAAEVFRFVGQNIPAKLILKFREVMQRAFPKKPKAPPAHQDQVGQSGGASVS